MPDPCKDEEIENRKNSLCLFGFPGITNVSRCEHCPGAARSSFHHLRCPLDQPNIFHPGESDGFRWSASSSKLHSHEAETELANTVAAMSLEGSHSGKFGRSKSYPLIHDQNTGMAVPPVGVGGKRKAAKMDRGLENLDVKNSLQKKPQKLLKDLETGNRYMPGCLPISSDSMAALMTKSLDHPSGKVSSVGFYCPGYIIIEGYGVCPCNDGIVNVNNPEEAGPMFMDIELPVHIINTEIEGCGDSPCNGGIVNVNNPEEAGPMFMDIELPVPLDQ